ncbi:MAG: biopolymer transporter ExbD [Puniceicoccales bacterium]|jgi:biopolymer transport protein ExbD|nr:biopolymer transporter ExbD [Puniceicoccales bacterium]
MRLFIFRDVSSLKEPDSTVDVWSVLCIVLFLFGIFLMGARFVFPPGIHLELPRADNISTSKIHGILTIRSSDMLLFNGRIFALSDLENELKFFIKVKNDSNEKIIILVRPDKNLGLGEFIHICEIIKSSGINEIHVAAEKSRYQPMVSR